MKRLFLALALVAFSAPALGQSVVNTYMRVVSPASIQLISNTALAITDKTANFYGQYVRVACTISCWIGFRLSGQTASVTLATGMWMPPNVPENFQVQRNSTISVIGNPSSGSDGGTIYINELGH